MNDLNELMRLRIQALDNELQATRVKLLDSNRQLNRVLNTLNTLKDERQHYRLN